MTILAYHQIDDRADFTWNRVSPERFRSQMKVLRDNGLRGGTLEESMKDVTGNVIGITFDDAMDGVIEHALPVLESFGFRASLFVPTAWPGRLNRWDTILVGRRARHATWEMLLTAHQAGWEIGSHGHVHKELTGMSDHDLEADLKLSRDRIEAHIGRPPTSIAYPFGSSDSRVASSAKRLGFRRGVLSAPATGDDPMFAGRMNVRRFDTSFDFRAKLNGGILYPFQVFKDRVARFCSLGTPRLWQRMASS